MMSDKAAAACLELRSLKGFDLRWTRFDYTRCKGVDHRSRLSTVTRISDRTVEAAENLQTTRRDALREFCSSGEVEISELSSRRRRSKDDPDGQRDEWRERHND